MSIVFLVENFSIVSFKLNIFVLLNKHRLDHPAAQQQQQKVGSKSTHCIYMFATIYTQCSAYTLATSG